MKPFYLSVILLGAVVCFSQEYYEASGQTTVFTLRAGACSGTETVNVPEIIKIKPVLSINTNHMSIIISLPELNNEPAELALYDITGRQVYRKNNIKRQSLSLRTDSFRSGFYMCIVKTGKRTLTKHFVLGR